jgi:hypothetical protein
MKCAETKLSSHPSAPNQGNVHDDAKRIVQATLLDDPDHSNHQDSIDMTRIG